MIARSDVILLLTELQNKGIDVKEEMNMVLRSSSIPLEALKKINDNRSLDILKFYECNVDSIIYNSGYLAKKYLEEHNA